MKGDRTLQIAMRVFDIAAAGVMVWIILPPSVKISVKSTVATEWQRVETFRKNRSAIRHLRFEVMQAGDLMDRYNLDHDASRFIQSITTGHHQKRPA
jgi:hypothetical protein